MVAVEYTFVTFGNCNLLWKAGRSARFDETCARSAPRRSFDSIALTRLAEGSRLPATRGRTRQSLLSANYTHLLAHTHRALCALCAARCAPHV